MKNAQKCIEAMEKKINTMEHSLVTVKGEKLSRADVETVKMYAESYLRSGGSSWNGLMEPFGSIAKVLESFGLKVQSAFGW